MTTTCTVVTGAPMIQCGAPAVTTFTTSRGDTFAECEAHSMAGATPAPVKVAPTFSLKTRSTAMYAMVDFGRDGVPFIAGYAQKFETASRRMHQAHRQGRPKMTYIRIVDGRVQVTA